MKLCMALVASPSITRLLANSPPVSSDLLLDNLVGYSQCHLQVCIPATWRSNVHGRTHIQTENNVVLRGVGTAMVCVYVCVCVCVWGGGGGGGEEMEEGHKPS